MYMSSSRNRELLALIVDRRLPRSPIEMISSLHVEHHPTFVIPSPLNYRQSQDNNSTTRGQTFIGQVLQRITSFSIDYLYRLHQLPTLQALPPKQQKHNEPATRRSTTTQPNEVSESQPDLPGRLGAAPATGAAAQRCGDEASRLLHRQAAQVAPHGAAWDESRGAGVCVSGDGEGGFGAEVMRDGDFVSLGERGKFGGVGRDGYLWEKSCFGLVGLGGQARGLWVQWLFHQDSGVISG